MAKIKISLKVDEVAWEELEVLADETGQKVSQLLSEAIRDYLRRRRIRSEVIRELDLSIAANETLGGLLAR